MASLASAPPPRPQSHEDYTVGWICALDLELTAALAMLDDWHEDDPPNFERPAADENFYHFGRICKHNVVITCLEAGTTGPVAAATAAKSMVFTFPNIKFGLLVGIGGAASQTNSEGEPIRLGDVAISQPTGTNGGVFQHDLRKAYPGGQTQSKSFLNKPPGVLLNALNGMRARLKLRPSKVPQFLDELPSKLRKQKDKLAYTHQGIHQDRLFDANYPHPGGADCSKCESFREVPRQDRDSNDPEFHYGVIASGGTVCKDAEFRDQIKEQVEGCICIEMEAAGLMNSFPCLVIRGISDYADSHKNDIWQPYAAATAAAYAKELLGFVQPQAVAGAEKALRIMNHIENIESRMNEIHRFTQRTKIHLSEQDIRNWLSPPNPSVNFNEAVEKHHPGTGTWFLDGEELRVWNRSQNSFMWLHGLAGSGKTVLSSAVIQKLRRGLANYKSTRPVIYFFFDFKTEEKQSLDKMARSLIYQLFKARPEESVDLSRLFTECRDGSEQPTRTSLLNTLKSLLQTFDEVRVVIDAVEEANQRDKQKLLDWIKTIHKSEIPNLHFLVSSRQEPDIERSLASLGISLQISAEAVFKDVSLFVFEQIQDADEHGLGKWKSHPKILEDIVEKLSSDAKGMFRLASLRLELLEQCSSVADLSEALNTLPSDINAAYDRVLEKIPRIWKERGLRILQFLIYSPQGPDARSSGVIGLGLYEAAEMLAVDVSHKSRYDADRKVINPADIVRFLPCLVEITRSSGVGPYYQEDYPYLQLAHFTVKEYLLSEKACRFFGDGLGYIKANVSLVRTSLAFLDHLSSKELSKELSPDLKFGRHASLWIEYGKIVDSNPIACEEILEFFNNTCALETWWVLYTTRNGVSSTTRSSTRGATPKTSLDNKTLEQKEKKPVFVSERPEFHASLKKERGSLPTPLYIAVRGQMLNVAKRLLNCDLSQVNDDASFWAPTIPLDSSRGSIHQIPFGFYTEGLYNTEVRRETALYAAASVGSKMLVRVLLDHGAEIGKQGGEAGTALMVAKEKNHGSCVEVLNSCLANLDQNDQIFALNLPTIRSSVQLLIEEALEDIRKPIEIRPGVYEMSRNTVGGRGLEARGGVLENRLLHQIFFAQELEQRHYDASLLETIIRAKTSEGESLVHAICRRGSSSKLLAALVGIGVEFRSLNDHGLAPLHYSAQGKQGPNVFAGQGNSREFIPILLSAGADVDQQDHDKRTPLHFAAIHGKMELAGILVEAGAYLEAVDTNGKMPWICALEGGFFNLAAFLHVEDMSTFGPAQETRAGANSPRNNNIINNTNHNNLGSLSYWQPFIRLLRDKRAPTYQRSGLHWAALIGDNTLFEALFSAKKKYWNTMERDIYGMTPISYAALHENDCAIKLLIDDQIKLLERVRKISFTETPKTLDERIQVILDRYDKLKPRVAKVPMWHKSQITTVWALHEALRYHQRVLISSIMRLFPDESLNRLRSGERQFGGPLGSPRKRRSTISSSRPAMTEPDLDVKAQECVQGPFKDCWDDKVGLLFLGAGAHDTRGWERKSNPLDSGLDDWTRPAKKQRVR